MSMPGKQTIENLIFNLAIIAAVIVLIFSVYNAYNYLMIVLRSVMAFIIIYSLGKGLMRIYFKFAPPPPEKRSTIDIILGDLSQREDNAEKTIPGQINADIKNGLQDPDNKAEIVKRMGLGEESEVLD